MTGASGRRAVFDRLVRSQTALWNAVDDAVRAGTGVPLTHVTALGVVAHTPGCRVQDLVSTLHITVGGASKTADRLVAAGHAVRRPNPTDRRSSVLETTAAGDELLRAATSLEDDVLRQRLGACFSEAELAQLEQLLTRLEVDLSPTAADTEMERN